MTTILLVVLGLLCVALIAWGLRAKGRYFEFPFLAGGTFISFVLPQLIGLQSNHELPPGALDQTIVMAILCAGMCYGGYAWRDRPLEKFNWPLLDQKLIYASSALTVVGAYFFFAISRLPEDVRESSSWTGLPVAYHFFAQALGYGFAIAMTLFADKGSKAALGVAMFAALFYLDRIFLSGRRGVTLEFVFVILLALWFGRRLALPRPIILAGLVLGTLALHSTGDYRAVAADEGGDRWKRVKDIAFMENLQKQLTEGGSEMANAVYSIAATERSGSYDFGVFHWNTLVFNYVPAQLLGEEFKQSLLVPLEDADAYKMYGHQASSGSTFSGLVDAFGSFWYFGCLKFFVIGFVLRRLYAAAMAGHFIAKILYMLMITNALHCITHHTQWFVSPWVHFTIFLFPALYYARPRIRATPRGSLAGALGESPRPA